MEYSQMNSMIQKANRVANQNVSGQVLRMFICTNIDGIFEANIIGGQVKKEEKRIYWNSLAEKIIINCPLFYKLLCFFKINKIFAIIIGRHE